METEGSYSTKRIKYLNVKRREKERRKERKRERNRKKKGAEGWGGEGRRGEELREGGRDKSKVRKIS